MGLIDPPFGCKVMIEKRGGNCVAIRQPMLWYVNDDQGRLGFDFATQRQIHVSLESNSPR
jgi:hypothetical protein